MSDVLTSVDEAILQRRRFLKGGAMLAAAAGGAVAATAGNILPASASGDPTFTTLTIAIPAERLIDTRTEDGRAAIIASSADAFDSKHRLRKGAWLDVFVLPSDETDFELVSLFVNLTSSGSVKSGSLTIAEPGEKPPMTTLSCHKGWTVSNGAFVGVGPVTGTTAPTAKGAPAEGLGVRIFAGGVTHVALDLVGASVIYAADTDPLLRTTSRRPQVEQLVTAIRAAH